MAISSPLKKTTLLLLITTLAISLGTSLSWDNPSEDSQFAEGDEFDLVVTNDTDSGTVEFWHQEAGANEYSNLDSDTLGNGNATYHFVVGSSTNSGTHSFKANSSEDEITLEFVIDTDAPTVTFPSNLDYVGEDPSITVDVEDPNTGIDSVDASIDSGDADIDDVDDSNCDGDSNCEVDISVDTGSVDEGNNFDLDVTAEDTVTNSKTYNKDEITLDSEYDGDESADIKWAESDGNILDGFENDDKDVTVSLEGDSVSKTTVRCMVDGEEIDDDTKDASGEEHDFDCEFDHDDFAGSRFDLSVEVEDQAGNDEGVIEEETMKWDVRSPVVTSVSHPDDISTFNNGFNLSVSASDDASGIDNIEYYTSPNTAPGDGTFIEMDEDTPQAIDQEFSLDPDLGQGNHTVYVRAVDDTGKWSDNIGEFDFEYYPDREAEIAITAPDSFELTSGESSSFDLGIENEAPFFIGSVKVSSDSAVWNDTVSVVNMENGDNIEKPINIDASELEPGVYELLLEADRTSESAEVEVIVKATEDQKTEIENRLNNWKSKSTELKENVSKIGTLEEDNENISSFTERISNAQSAVESGEYYRAVSSLEGIESDFEEAQQTFAEKKKVHDNNVRNRIIFAFVGLLVLGGGAVGFMAYREENFMGDYSLPDALPDDWEIDVPDNIPELGLAEKAREVLNDAEEEVEEHTGQDFEFT